jgi:hypothetical protein
MALKKMVAVVLGLVLICLAECTQSTAASQSDIFSIPGFPVDYSGHLNVRIFNTTNHCRSTLVGVQLLTEM